MSQPEIVVEAISVDGAPPSPKPETVWECDDCLRVAFAWRVRCPSCGSYNSLIEKARAAVAMKPMRAGVPQWENRLVTSHGGVTVEMPPDPSDPRMDPEAPKLITSVGQGKLINLKDVPIEDMGRVLTGETELDFLLGGGMVSPGVIMIGGDPGVGKSTLLTQVWVHIGKAMKAVYGCGEESHGRVAARAARLLKDDTKGNPENCLLLQGTDYDVFENQLLESGSKFAILDSLQTFRAAKDNDGIAVAADVKTGSVRMTSAIAERYHKFCHKNNVIGWIVCHVTKDGEFAGPQVVNHAIDANVMLTAMDDGTVAGTSTKNRDGATNVAGMFRMTEKGLKSYNG